MFNSSIFKNSILGTALFLVSIGNANSENIAIVNLKNKKENIELIKINTISTETEPACFKHFYLGADAQIRHMSFVPDFGRNVFKKDYPQANVYFGVKGNQYVGLEVGFEGSSTKTRKVYVDPGLHFGVQQDEPLRQNAIVRLRGFHASLVGFLPICFCGNDNFSLIGGIGVLNLKVRLANTVTEVDNIPALFRENLVQSKNVLRLMTGIQYNFNDCFGIRANVRWENTSQLRNIEPVRLRSRDTAKLRNSIVYGLGVFFQF